MKEWKKYFLSAVLFFVSAVLVSFVFGRMVAESCGANTTLGASMIPGARQIACADPPLLLAFALFVLMFIPVIGTVYLFTRK